MPTGDGPSLSLRPFPVADKKAKNVAEFIARVNAQPGGFRDVTEEKLREELRAAASAEEQGSEKPVAAAEGEDAVMSDGEREGEDDGEDDEADSAAKDPAQARMEVLKNIEIAGNTAMLMIDSLSLLLSKQNPTQAGLTLSQQLRDMVGIGTLAVDKLDDSANVPPAKAKDSRDVAVGWTLMEISQTRDLAEEASRFLRRETEAEGRYWEDVVKVQRAGWSICSVPKERHTLGVRFGFSEAAPDFRNNGLAPMRRGDDGSVQLDCGKLGGVSERLLVTFEKDGKVVGRSALPAETSDDAPLEARVLEARNTIFAQELWHELSREARSLLSYDVRPTGSKLICDVDANSTITIELVPLESTPLSNDDLPDNQVAETVSLTLHVLLSYAHRYNELARIRPLPPHIPRPKGQQPYALLRPIIARMMSIRSIRHCTEYVGGLVSTLKKAGLSADFTLHTPPIALSEPVTKRSNKPSAAQSLVRNLLLPLEFNLKITLLTDAALTIRGRTFLQPVTTTYYPVPLPPTSSLQTLCPPFKEGYADLNALSQYLNTATARLLTDHTLTQLQSNPSDENMWAIGVSGNSVLSTERKGFEMRFAVKGDPPVLYLNSPSLSGPKPGETQEFRWGSNNEETKSLGTIIQQLAGAGS